MKTIIFASIQIESQFMSFLSKSGPVVLVPELEKTYKSINTHPDIQLTVINNTLMIDQDAWVNLHTIRENKLILNQLKPLIIRSKLGNRYPLSVPFNGKFLENTWIHHLEYTDNSILRYLKNNQMQLIHTNQGYSGCSLLLLPGYKGITSDLGLAKTLIDFGYDILLIKEGFIKLDGLNHGFIGGCCGYYNKKVYVHGDLSLHPDGEKIRQFIYRSNLETIELEGYPLTDIGSIIFYEEI